MSDKFSNEWELSRKEQSQLPPLSYDHVFSVSSTSLIDAPREEVWKVLLDFPNYGQWNSFVYSMTLTDQNKSILPDQRAAIGKHAQVLLNFTPKVGGPSGLFSRGSAFVKIDSLGHENFCFSWSNASTMPSFLFRSKRWQTLSVDENTGKTKYYNVEFVSGLLAYFARFTLGSKLKVCFQAAAEDLKKRAEEK